MNRLGASSMAIFGVLIVIIILIAIVYGVNSGLFKVTGSKSTTPSVFTISASFNTTSLYAGKSAPMYLTFFNPFNQPVNMLLNVSVGSPNYVSLSPTSKVLDMPANMSNSSIVQYSVSCLSSSSGVSSTYVFSSQVRNFWQNFTTSVITYPYNTKQNLIPQTIYDNSNQGFMSFSALPLEIETQIPSGPLSQTLNLVMTPSFGKKSGYIYGPYTNISAGSPNDYIKSITLKITNSSGIASASVYYDGQTYPFSVSKNNMTLTMNNVNLALIPSGLPVDITATNSNETSQNIINININYGYYFSFTGSPNDISCI